MFDRVSEGASALRSPLKSQQRRPAGVFRTSTPGRTIAHRSLDAELEGDFPSGSTLSWLFIVGLKETLLNSFCRVDLSDLT